MRELPALFFNSTARSGWLRLRTLIMLRWLAVGGQAAALLMATEVLNLDLRLDLCITAIGFSAAFNIIATVIFPENNRLSERSATLALLFDLCQLSALLFLTGGLSNPFSVLMLTPVVISATTLTLRATALLALVFFGLITVLIQNFMPLTTRLGQLIQMPELLIYGTWSALIISALFLATYARRVTLETFLMSEALTATQLALGREQKLTALGGVVAAAAHELGTPLATIKLTAAELADELSDHPELYRDAELIGTQADRCRDILRDMGRSGKDDMHLHHALVSTVVSEAAEPHLERGKKINIRINGISVDAFSQPQPQIPRHPEIIHGLRNLIQNAVDFSTHSVWVDITWDVRDLRIHIRDDGPGYPTDIIGKIGDPFVRRRKRKRPAARADYEGMGLGLFIAKTLLERSGARLTFANIGQTTAVDTSTTGAMVEVTWKRAEIESDETQTRGPLGLNQHITN
ncbi:MAG: ActS/PrrB/RegB family redox-sensitive histidine kinase [Paracoccaceae bacterium]